MKQRKFIIQILVDIIALIIGLAIDIILVIMIYNLLEVSNGRL